MTAHRPVPVIEGASAATRPTSSDASGLRLTLAVAFVAITCVLVARVGVIAEVRAIAAALVVLALPTAVGGVLRVHAFWGIGAELALRFGLGNVLLLLIAAACNAVGIFSVTLVAWIALAAIGAAAGMASVRRGDRVFASPRRWIRTHAGALVPHALGAGGAVAACVYWRSRSPLPYQSTWDGLLHLGAIERMLAENRFSLSLTSMSPGFPPDAYLPAYHVGIAAASRLTAVPALNILWAGPFALTAVAGAGIAALALRIWPNRIAVGAACVVCGLLMASPKSTNPLVAILPASEVTAVVPMALLVLAERDRKRRLLRGCAISAVLASLHPLMAALLFGVVVGSEAAAWALCARRSVRVAAAAVIGLAALGAAVLLAFASQFQPHVPATAISPSFYGSLTSAAGLRSRLGLLAGMFPHLLPGLLALSAAAALLVRRRPDARLVVLRGAPVVIFVGFAVPVAGLERLEGFLWLAMTIASAAILSGLAQAVRLIPQPSAMRPWSALVLITLVPVLAWPMLAQPLSTWRTHQRQDTSEGWLQSSFSSYELHEIPRFAARYGRARPVVSDPETQQIAEAFGRLDSVGGIHMPPARDVSIVRALVAPSRRLARERLRALQAQFGSFLLVVTGRTERWGVIGEGILRNDSSADETLAHYLIYRPWDFSALPDSRVPRTKGALLRPILRSGCARDVDDAGEIVAMIIDCRRS